MRAKPDGTIPPHHGHCLGCGPENPASMGLQLRIDGERIVGTVRFDRRQEGAPGFAHGGAVATVLDDALGSLLIVLRRPAVTANLSVDYRHPAFLDHDLTVEAWVVGIEGRKFRLAGRVLDGETVVAEGEALFLEVDLEHFRRSGRELPGTWQSWGEDEADAA